MLIRRRVVMKRIASFRNGRIRKKLVLENFLEENLSWLISSIREKIAAVNSNHGTGILKPSIRAVNKVMARPNIRLSRLTFLDKTTPIMMPRMIDDEVGL